MRSSLIVLGFVTYFGVGLYGVIYSVNILASIMGMFLAIILGVILFPFLTTLERFD